MIETLITVALLFYFAAYLIARKRKYPLYVHISVASIGFAMDMYATYLMSNINQTNPSIVVTIHTTLTMIAIALFGVQAALGILRKRNAHIWFAQKVFLPMWIISYMSGFLFFIF